MKILKFLSVLIFVASSIFLSAQNQELNNVLSKSLIDNNSALKQIISNADLLNNSFDICGESFEWDSQSQQFEYNGSTLIEYEDNDGQKTLSITLEVTEDGESNSIKLINYFSFQDLTFQGELLGDSTLIFTADANGNFKLLSKTINYFEDEKVVLSEEYFDYSLVGLPFGVVKSVETRYYYDQENHLVATASDNFDFSTFSLIFSDSSSYVNNAFGFPTERIDYQPDFFSGEVSPYNKENYTYINDLLLEETIIYFYDGNDFVISNKVVNEYDEMDRRIVLIQYYTEDNGLNYEATNRNLSNYQEVLPFDIPSSELAQQYDNEEWLNESLNTFENCIIDNTEEFITEIEVWIDKNTLYLKDFEIEANTKLAVYSMSGQLLIQLNGSQIKQEMDVSALTPGVYAVEVRTQDGRFIEKVAKSN